MVVVRMFYECIKSITAEIASTGFPARAAVPGLAPPRKLKWKINDVLSVAIEAASSHMLKLIQVCTQPRARVCLAHALLVRALADG